MSILTDEKIANILRDCQFRGKTMIPKLINEIAKAQDIHTRKEVKRELEKLLISTSSMEAVTLPIPNFYIRETALNAFWDKY